MLEKQNQKVGLVKFSTSIILKPRTSLISLLNLRTQMLTIASTASIFKRSGEIKYFVGNFTSIPFTVYEFVKPH